MFLISATELLTYLDDILPMSVLDQCPSFQVSNRYLGQLRPGHDLLPINLWLPSLLHRVQMVSELVCRWRISSRPAQHVDLHVPPNGAPSRRNNTLSLPGARP